MRVLVTRPEPAASKTAGALRACGHEPVILPLACVVYNSEAARCALPESQRKLLAATSATAAASLARLGDELRPILEYPLFAVGEKTAAAFSKTGFKNIIAGTGDGAGLARLLERRIAADRNTDGVLYFAGVPRAGGLERRMKSRGVPVTVCECYRIEAMTVNPDELARRLFEPEPVDAILLYSAESARRLLTTLETAKLQLPASARFYCLSENIRRALPVSMRSKAQASRTASGPELLNLLDWEKKSCSFYE